MELVRGAPGKRSCPPAAPPSCSDVQGGQKGGTEASEWQCRERDMGGRTRIQGRLREARGERQREAEATCHLPRVRLGEAVREEQRALHAPAQPQQVGRRVPYRRRGRCHARKLRGEVEAAGGSERWQGWRSQNAHKCKCTRATCTRTHAEGCGNCGERSHN